jgi:hypothetical protein
VYSELDKLSEVFPEELFKMKVLPELLKSVEFGGGGPKVLNAILKIGAKLTEDEYASRITPVIIRLFANPDRALRISLLDGLPLMIDYLPQRVVNDKIFPQMVRISEITLEESMGTHQCIDLWLHRCCADGARADCESCLNSHQQAVRSGYQRGVVKILGTNCKR